jgi:NAD(P)-dependent dehydrogenase (short-subunit alcohol dehydrogenase family)
VLSRSAGELEAVAREIGDLGQRGVALVADVTSLDDVTTATERAVSELGSLDALVNNAGGPIFNAPFLDVREQGWARVLELNLMSVVRLCQAVGAHMVEQGSGSIVNVDSIGASHAAPNVSPYCAAKAAVVNLTQALAQEWAPHGVRVNALSPGLIDTDVNARLVNHPELGAALARQVPLGRWGEPEDVTGAAVWLASDASAYVTGAQIPVNGGLGIVAPQVPRPA